MIHIVCSELVYFKKSFSREKTFLWFGLCILAFMGNCDPIGGVSGLVRTLGLQTMAYGGLLGLFQSSAVLSDVFQIQIFEWIRSRFKNFIVTISGRELLILDAKKQAKAGKRMPGVKWHHQDSQSSSKKEYVTAHSFECMGLAVKCFGSVSCLLFLIKMIDGIKKHNKDTKTLKEKVGEFIAQNTSMIAGRIIVCDAWYAAQQIINAALSVSAEIVTRVGKNAVAYHDPISKKGAKGRPCKYGTDLKLYSLFDTLKGIAGEVKNCSDEIQKVAYWSIELMWPPIKRKVLFVGSTDERGRRIVLLATDLNMQPLEVIQAYVYRSSIEHTFWLSTQFFSSWTYRFWTKLPLVKRGLKGNFNLHWSNENLRKVFYSKIKSYEMFLTFGFLAHSMFLFLGIKFKEEKINDKILFFRFRNRSACASVPIMRAMFVSEYQKFIRCGKSDSEIEKFLIEKHKNCIFKEPLQKAA